MGWHPCSKCKSEKWTLHVHPRGCDQCIPDFENIIAKETNDFFKRHKGKKLVGGMSLG